MRSTLMTSIVLALVRFSVSLGLTGATASAAGADARASRR